LVEVCRIVDAPECAAPIYERLVPYAQTLCVLSLNLSEMHFEDALATCERIDARMLPSRGAAGDAERAQILLVEARSIAERIGQGGVLADAANLSGLRAGA
jgi:hypothetical protein